MLPAIFKQLRTAILAASALFICAFPACAQSINTGNNGPWFKADLHTHYTFSGPLEDEIARYRETGYNFLVLSTKDSQKTLDYEKHSSPELLIINGVEQAFLTRKKELGHALGFRIKKVYPFTTGWTLKEGWEKLRKRNERALLGVNHPHDGRWTLEDVMEAAAEGVTFFELNSIDMKHGEFETALWDESLSGGARLYATLVNDVHSFGDIDAYGYILVRAEKLDYGNMALALLAGDFYAVESGCAAEVKRHEIVGTGNGKQLVVSAPGAVSIRVIGDGKTFAEIDAEEAIVPLEASLSYVRVEITDTDGLYTFMQPFFLKENNMAETSE